MESASESPSDAAVLLPSWNLDWFYFGGPICLLTKDDSFVKQLALIANKQTGYFQRLIKGTTRLGEQNLVGVLRSAINARNPPIPYRWPLSLPAMPSYEFARQRMFVLGPKRFALPWPIPAADPSDVDLLEAALKAPLPPEESSGPNVELKTDELSEADFEINIDDVLDACHYYVKETGRGVMVHRRGDPYAVRELVRTRARVPDYTTISIPVNNSGNSKPTNKTNILYNNLKNEGLDIELGWIPSRNVRGRKNLRAYAEWPCGAVSAL